MAGFYAYTPSLPAAIIFIILFLITALFHTFQLLRTRTWFYTALTIGAHMEWIGYIGRAIGATQAPAYTSTPFILQTVLLLVAPSLFSATIYMTLGRIVRACSGERHLFIRLSWLTKIFVCGDVFCFLVQAAGAAILAGSITKGGADAAGTIDTANDVIIVGLVLQILFFSVFVAAAVIFHVKMRKDVSPWTEGAAFPWVKHMTALYGASFLILVRSIYRVVEYAQGHTGTVQSTEWYVYVFDAMLMLVVLFIFNIVHGSALNAYLKGGNRVRDVEQTSLRTMSK